MSEPSISPIGSTDSTTLGQHELQAIEAFAQSAREQGMQPVTCLDNPHCGVFLRGEAAESWGTDDLPCLAVYQDELGNWVTLVRSTVEVMAPGTGRFERGTPRIVQFILGSEVL